MNILLFDIDGVLVDDLGYRGSLETTVNHFSRLMGQGDSAPESVVVELFQVNGFTNEWDICAFALGALIVSTLRANGDLELTHAPLEELLTQFKVATAAALDYEEWITAVRDRAGSASERARTVLDDALGAISLSDVTRAAVKSALDQVLADPYDVPNAIITRVFQEHALGSSLFDEVYRIASRFDARSLLFDKDRSLLNADGRAMVRRLVSDGSARACIYSTRPSLPPVSTLDWLAQSTRPPLGYAPEAELAMQLIKMDELPLIALGRMQWLAERVGTRVEYLVKPSPMQALAAVIAALSQKEAEAVEAAYRMMSEGDLPSILTELDGHELDVWVVEDSVIGVHAAGAAIELINKGDIHARLRALGISANGPKADALHGLCEVIVPDVNEAITYIADHIQAAQLT